MRFIPILLLLAGIACWDGDAGRSGTVPEVRHSDSLRIEFAEAIPSIVGGYDSVYVLKRGPEVIDSLNASVMDPAQVGNRWVYVRYARETPGTDQVVVAETNGTVHTLETPLLNTVCSRPIVIDRSVYYWGFEAKPLKRTAVRRPYRIYLVGVNVQTRAVDSVFVRRDSLYSTVVRYYHPVRRDSMLVFPFQHSIRDTSQVFVAETDPSLSSLRIRRWEGRD